MAEDAVVVARDEYAEFRRDSRVPGEEVLQIGRVEAFVSVTGTDEDVGLGWYGKPPIQSLSFRPNGRVGRQCMQSSYWACHQRTAVII